VSLPLVPGGSKQPGYSHLPPSDDNSRSPSPGQRPRCLGPVRPRSVEVCSVQTGLLLTAAAHPRKRHSRRRRSMQKRISLRFPIWRILSRCSDRTRTSRFPPNQAVIRGRSVLEAAVPQWCHPVQQRNYEWKTLRNTPQNRRSLCCERCSRWEGPLVQLQTPSVLVAKGERGQKQLEYWH